MKMNAPEMATEVLNDPSEREARAKARRRRELIAQDMAEEELKNFNPNAASMNGRPGCTGEDY